MELQDNDLPTSILSVSFLFLFSDFLWHDKMQDGRGGIPPT